MAGELTAYQIRITGIVQGVGFRPFVYRLAQQYHLKGWVLNSSAGVVIEAEGDRDELQEFAHIMVESPPPLAVIRNCELKAIEPRGFEEFSIRHSESEADKAVMISPDIAICEDCKREVMDASDRRRGYPFTNCTNCGPRFTIIKDVPYDRAQTTMAPFPMCRECRQEYENPLHRRFHAQPNACPVCGPHTTLVDRQGREVKEKVVTLLKQGYIVAVKGLGAFHLAADAASTDAVKNLRQRKHRNAKPFAVMARDLQVADRYCLINDIERKWLTSPQAPIVILERKDDSWLPDELIHPGISTLGVMLPYTPLHYLLFDDELELLLMTSANISDEPLIINNQEAMEKLSEVADFFLLHNREIFNPCDDSVMRVTPLLTPQLLRRARGFVPLGIELPVKTRPVLALGGEMKSTFCMTRDGEAFLSQHWGDLSHYHNYCKFLDAIPRFKKMLDVEPEVIAHDLHPNYQTTRWAREQTGIKRVAVQHHYAHLAAAMVDNGLTGEVLGVICDGTGWGTDSAVWGFEILQGDYHSFQRLGHLGYVPLPGGDLAIRRPYRMALVYLLQAWGEEGLELAERYLPALGREEKQVVWMQVNKGLQVVPTSSCGRLFDAVAALLGVCSLNRYEGQAAIELEAIADRSVGGYYDYELERQDGQWLLNVFPMWHGLAADLQQGQPVETMAGKFHNTLVGMITGVLKRVRDETGLNRVVLSGGVFHNQILLLRLVQRLLETEFIPYHHQQVPPGDGGISLGQAVIASEVEL